MSKANLTDIRKLDSLAVAVDSNQFNANPSDADPAENSPKVTPAVEESVATKSPETDQDPLKGSNSAQPALRGDLIELHNRMIDMFKTLSTGLTALTTEKAEKDRASLAARIDEMEQALNTMEGMMRIEMVPQFRSVLNEALDERELGAPSRLGASFITFALIAAGVAAGTIWSAEIKSTWIAAADYLRNLLT